MPTTARLLIRTFSLVIFLPDKINQLGFSRSLLTTVTSSFYLFIEHPSRNLPCGVACACAQLTKSSPDASKAVLERIAEPRRSFCTWQILPWFLLFLWGSNDADYWSVLFCLGSICLCFLVLLFLLSRFLVLRLFLFYDSFVLRWCAVSESACTVSNWQCLVWIWWEMFEDLLSAVWGVSPPKLLFKIKFYDNIHVCYFNQD